MSKLGYSTIIISLIFLFVVLMMEKHYCKEETKVLLGNVQSAEETYTSFNDSRRMKLNVTESDNAGIYFIRGITNVKIGEPIYLVTTVCGQKRIKIGDNLFKTYEN